MYTSSRLANELLRSVQVAFVREATDHVQVAVPCCLLWQIYVYQAVNAEHHRFLAIQLLVVLDKSDEA